MTPFDVLSTIRQAGGRVVVLDGDLQVVAPPGTVSVEAAAVLREYKAALIGILPDAEREAIGWVETLDQAEAGRSRIEQILAKICDSLDQDQDDQDQEVEPISCSICGGIDAWWDLGGRWHCTDCDPPIRSEMLQHQAVRLRRVLRCIGCEPAASGEATLLGGMSKFCVCDPILARKSAEKIGTAGYPPSQPRGMNRATTTTSEEKA